MYPGRVAADMFETVLDEYYDWRGWEKASGLQTAARLTQLDMDDVAEVLSEDGALAES
jgi:aldehyde:ferredoxin oxidoreductase